MNRSLQFTVLLAAVVLVVGVTGCKKGPKSPTPIPTGANPGPIDEGPNGLDGGTRFASTGGPTGSDLEGVPPTGGDWAKFYDPDPNYFARDTVYFDFDRSSIKSSEQAKIARVADHLRDNPRDAVLVEGNCDERGTEGYNMSLGERRALAVREYLVNLGIVDKRIYTISYGETKPADPGHDEAAWALNRRADFVLLRPKTQ